MDEQDKSIDDQPTSNGRAEITQVGQVLRSLTSVTRQLPAPPPPRQLPPNSAMRERIHTLIAALGDTEHPQHQTAVQDLVAIGDPAVLALNEALSPRRPWLTAYRAAEAIGQIGDGRATGALIEALRHPNSNVRWSAVRALAAIGDARAMLDLRRVAREDRAKTSWGESVGGAAQSALDQMRTQNVLLRGAELVKTAVACVIMLVSLVLAWSVVTTLRAELQRVGQDQVDVEALFAPVEATPDAAALESQPAPLDTPAPTAAPTAEASTTSVVTGTVLTTANVRSSPEQSAENRIGIVSQGDNVVFVGATADNKWFRIKLDQPRSDGSSIDSPDGTGWVIATLLSEPQTSVPVDPAGQPAP